MARAPWGVRQPDHVILPRAAPAVTRVVHLHDLRRTRDRLPRVIAGVLVSDRVEVSA